MSKGSGLLLLLAVTVFITASCQSAGEHENTGISGLSPQSFTFPSSIISENQFAQYRQTFLNEDYAYDVNTSGFFKADDLSIFMHRLPAQNATGPPRGSIWIIHGFLHHSGYYLELARDFQENGWTVYLFDLPGHGLSSGPRASIDDFGVYGQVIEKALEISKSEEDSGLRIAMGHSTGASSLIEYALQDGELFDQYIFVSPLVRSASWKLSRIGFALGGRRYRSIPRIIRKSSGDSAFMDFMRNQDYLAPRFIDTRWISSLYQWNTKLESISSEAWERAFADKDVVLIQGTRDSIVDWEYNIPALSAYISHAEFHILDGANHDLFFEAEPFLSEFNSIVEEIICQTPK